MRITQLFRAFLVSHQYLELPSIGRFELFSGEQDQESQNSKRQYIRFSRETKTEPDQQFIEFTCTRHRIDPYIAVSDLMTFCASVRELLMQGFEAEIPQIGYLCNNQNQQLVFSTSSRYKTISRIYRKKLAPVFKSSFWL